MRTTLTVIAFIFSLSAYSADFKMIVDLSTEMPLADVRGDKLVDGIHRWLGFALGKELNRKPVFLLLPRNRIGLALESGEGDLACQFRPEWLTGRFDWTIPFMPNGVLLISDLHVSEPNSLAKLANVPIGTVLGFSYPEVDQILGARFLREETRSASLNLKKIEAGRMHYALVGELFFYYQKKIGQFKTPIHKPVVVTHYIAQCAVSRHGQVKVTDINSAIEKIQKNNELQAIYDRYR